MDIFTFKDISNEIQAYRQGKFVYIGIPKNALVTHANVFRDAGWEQISWGALFEEAPADQWTFFSHIQNPHIRHTKGTVEYLFRFFDWREKLNDRRADPDAIDELLHDWLHDEKNGEAISMMVQGVFDQHTIPITTLVRSVGIDPWKVNWIPMDHPDYNTESLTNNYLSGNKIPLRVSFEQRRHIANDFKRRSYDLIHNMKLYSLVQTPNPFGGGDSYVKHFMSTVLREDIELYIQVMKSNNVDLYAWEDPNRDEELAKLNLEISQEYMTKVLGYVPDMSPEAAPDPNRFNDDYVEDDEPPTNNTGSL